MRKLLILALLATAPSTVADVSMCACDPASDESMAARPCSLCAEAEKQPDDIEVFFLKDISPRKPNRWLALPRTHGHGPHSLSDMSHAERTVLWKAAIAKARELWGDEWGLAYNGERVRTQCHAHIHIGKLLQGVETRDFIVVKGPEEIPAPVGTGLWVHPHGKRLHVHLNEQLTETVLLR
ncbi:MAG: hypothetical protein ACK5AZ_00915 [Bryobacteraceae bacterium]